MAIFLHRTFLRRLARGGILTLLAGSLNVSVLPIEPAWAGAWTVPRNRWYAEYFYRYFYAKKDFNQDGDSNRKANVGRFSDIRNEWKFEYGLTDWLNVLAAVPYQSAHSRDDNSDALNTGVGDIYVRTKLRYLEKPVVSSVQFSWKIPSAYDPKVSPGLGDGQVDFESRLLVSRAWTFAPLDASRRAASSQDHPAMSDVMAHHTTALSREEAMREAVMVAELYQRGERLYAAGDYDEAAKWFQAVLESHPEHYEVLRVVLNHALAEITTEADPQIMTVDYETFEPVLAALGDGSWRGVSETADDTQKSGVAFLNLEGAFTARNEDPANEFPVFFEAGFTPLKRLMLVGTVESTLSVNSTNEDQENFAKWGLRGIVNVWGDGFASVFKRGGPTVNVEIGYNDIVAGRNTADAYEVFGKIGVFF